MENRKKKDFKQLNRVTVIYRSTLRNIIVVPKKEQKLLRTENSMLGTNGYKFSLAHSSNKLNKPWLPHAP